MKIAQLLLAFYLTALIGSFSAAEVWPENYRYRLAIGVQFNYSQPVLQRLQIPENVCYHPDCRDSKSSETLGRMAAIDFDSNGFADTEIFMINKHKFIQDKKKSEYRIVQNPFSVVDKENHTIIQQTGPCEITKTGLKCASQPSAEIRQAYLSTTVRVNQGQALLFAESIVKFEKQIDENANELGLGICFRSFEIEKTQVIEFLSSSKISNPQESSEEILSDIVMQYPIGFYKIINNSPLIIAKGEKYGYTFLNFAHDQIVFSADENTSHITFCTKEQKPRNFLDDLTGYIHNRQENTLNLAREAWIAKAHPLKVLKIEEYMVDYIDPRAIRIDANIHYLDEGKTFSDIEFEFKIKREHAEKIIAQNETILPLKYTRLDKNEVETAEYSYENGKFAINIKNYRLNSSRWLWPFDKYSAAINITSLSFEPKILNKTAIDESSGYETTLNAKDTLLEIAVQPQTNMVIWRLAAVILFTILLWAFLHWKSKFGYSTLNGANLAALAGFIITGAVTANSMQLIPTGNPVSIGLIILIAYFALCGWLVWKYRRQTKKEKN